MTEHKYKIYLDEKLIGSTALEKADIPMGVLFGQILFYHIDNAYLFFKSYCLQKKIGITDEKQDQILITRHIPYLRVIDTEDNDICGASISVAGQGPVDFEITIEGVPHNILSFKFKHHLDDYRTLFDQHYEIDNIAEIGIDDKERLFIKPEKTTFP
ncbi:MAG TPA: hypothetical protein VK173_06955, partial [Lacibacter sp.]|nr:hypothetical protein [Lacibacter sp.]